MAVDSQLIDAIVHEYLQKKDKNLAQVFQHKTKAVSAIHNLIFFSNENNVVRSGCSTRALQCGCNCMEMCWAPLGG